MKWHAVDAAGDVERSTLVSPYGKTGGRELDAPECNTMRDANRLIATITEYWLARGFEPPTFTVERYKAEGTGQAWYAVRSDMVAGLPRQRRKLRSA